MKRTHYLDLHFKYSRPSGPSAWIRIKHCDKWANDVATIGDHGYSMRDMEREVKNLKDELDLILIKARKKFTSVDVNY